MFRNVGSKCFCHDSKNSHTSRFFFKHNQQDGEEYSDRLLVLYRKRAFRQGWNDGKVLGRAFVCATSKKKRKQHWHCRNCFLGSVLMWGIVKYRGRRRANQRPPSLPLIEFFGLKRLECLVASAELHLSDFVLVDINACGLCLFRNLDPLPLDSRDDFAILQNIEFLLGVIGRELVGPRLELRASDR